MVRRVFGLRVVVTGAVVVELVVLLVYKQRYDYIMYARAHS